MQKNKSQKNYIQGSKKIRKLEKLLLFKTIMQNPKGSYLLLFINDLYYYLTTMATVIGQSWQVSFASLSIPLPSRG